MDIDIVNWTPARMGWTGLDIKPVWWGLDWAGLVTATTATQGTQTPDHSRSGNLWRGARVPLEGNRGTIEGHMGTLIALEKA